MPLPLYFKFCMDMKLLLAIFELLFYELLNFLIDLCFKLALSPMLVGLYRCYDAWLWTCEETLFRAKGFNEEAQFLIN